MGRCFLAVAGCAALMAFSSGSIAAPKDLLKSEPAASTVAASAQAPAEPGVPADPEIGRQINEVCAGCHGPLGEGGKKGEYPRLAGQSFEYLKAQLTRFKRRQRVNIPMFPYTEERELPDEDIVHIAAYLAGIKLDSTPPVFKENEDALARLTAMAKVFSIPRAEGDVDAGAKLYKQECALCHGLKGRGYKETPMLTGQYTQYLKRQINKFIAGERIHEDLDDDLSDPAMDVLNQLKPEEIRDILAYLSALN